MAIERAILDSLGEASERRDRQQLELGEKLLSVLEKIKRCGFKDPFPEELQSQRWSRTSKLSPREVEVLGLAAKGLTNHQIAKELKIAVPTTKKHVSAILFKLGVNNRTEASARYLTSHPQAQGEQTGK